MTVPKELRRRVKAHRMPTWWLDAKVGVFIHWTPASVPAFAPRDRTVTDVFASSAPDAFAEMPYTEWYQNSLRFTGSSASEFHRTHHPGETYDDFVAAFRSGLEHWDPAAWARAFRDAGARYVVLVAKHHDGFCLWPSEVRNPMRSNWHSERDVVGELADAVRAEGLRFGLYYSGGLDWTFNDHPVGHVGDVALAVPRSDGYPDYADAQVRELIERYRPSVLWNDILWPAPAREMFELFDHYYRQVPDGVVNDRWLPWSAPLASARLSPVRRLINSSSAKAVRERDGMVPPTPPHFDVRTPEYVTFDEPQSRPWECVRGIDHSFGYNAGSRPEDFLTRDELLGSLAGIVATGGNLLLNVGPRGVDATIPDEQLLRLEWMGEWLRGEAASVFCSRPWVFCRGVASGADVLYWSAGDSVWAALDRGSSTVTLTEVAATPTTAVFDSSGEPLAFEAVPDGLTLAIPERVGYGPVVVRLDHVRARPERSDSDALSTRTR